jgi:hypothetical protein
MLDWIYIQEILVDYRNNPVHVYKYLSTAAESRPGKTIFVQKGRISPIVADYWIFFIQIGLDSIFSSGAVDKLFSKFQEIPPKLNTFKKLRLFYKPFYVFDRFKLRDVYFSLWGNLLVHSYLRFQATDLHKFGLVGNALAHK